VEEKITQRIWEKLLIVVASELKRGLTDLRRLRMMGRWMEVRAYMDIGVKLIIGFPLNAYWDN
jgi:hypothetical protein